MTFYEQRDFLNKDLCQWLVKFHQEYYDKLGMPVDLNQRKCLDLYSCCYFLKLDTDSNPSDPIKYVISLLNNHISKINKNSFINYSQIVNWPAGSYQPSHRDFDYHPLTSIIYLNNDFEGGETLVGDQKIFPEIGKIVSFSGKDTYHEVLPVKSGSRFTIATWYKNFTVI